MARNKNLIFGAVFVLLVFVSLLAFQGASAQTAGPTGFERICAFQDANKRPIEGALAKCVQQIYILALGLGSIVAFLMIILAGYRYMSAQGNAQQVESAKEAFASAFIGLIVIFIAFILLYLINPDLVRFRPLGFSSPTTQRSGEAPTTVTGRLIQGALVGNQFIQSGLGGASLESDGSIVMLASNGQRLVLTPSSVSSLPGLFEQSLRALGLDPSSVSMIEYDVNDPSLLPDSVVRLMNGARPSRILVVVGSFFLFNADSLHADTTGQSVLEAINLIALNHYGVDISILNTQPGSYGSCGTTCRLCDNNPAQCSAAPGCASYTTFLGNTECIALSSTGSVNPPSGSCPAGSVWSGHMDASGQPICNGTATTSTCQQPPSGSCSSGTCWTGHMDTSQNPAVPICQTAGGGTTGGTSPPSGSCPAGQTFTNWAPPLPSCISSTPSKTGSFTPCTLNIYCEDPTTGANLTGTGGTPGGCEGIGNQRVECYYSWQSQDSIDCDRTYRRERESCMRELSGRISEGAPGVITNTSGLPSCDRASPGSACTSSDGAVHCSYSDQQEAFYCGQAWSGTGTGYCLPGQTTNCFPAPDCAVVNRNPSGYSLGVRAACQ